MWCADGRKADVFCRWEDGTIGRPIVVAWLELRSRKCLGYEVGRTESADLIRLAFKRSAERVKALPRAALMDNGRGFCSKLLTGGAPTRFRFKVSDEDIPGILTLLGVKTIFATPFSGRSKPIESWFRAFAEVDKRFPGAYVGAKPGDRPEDFDQKKAVPIAQFRKALDEAIALYHDTPHRGDAMDGRTPNEVYLAELPSTVVRQPTVEQLRLCLLAAEKIRLQKDGSIILQRNRYWDKALCALPVGVDYVVRHNPEDASEPVAVYRGDRFLCEARLYERTGFRDQEAAKAHNRARREFQRAKKLEAAAILGMREAKRWLPRPPNDQGKEAEPETTLDQKTPPTPNVIELVRPKLDHRPEPLPPSPADTEEEEYQQAIAAWRDSDANHRPSSGTETPTAERGSARRWVSEDEEEEYQRVVAAMCAPGTPNMRATTRKIPSNGHTRAGVG